ncbi:MAG: SDR family NAD(P)-dependent oxidoreductase [Acidimicrobiales bacterium]
MPPTFADRYGPWAIVTGAAQGMGAAFARDLVGRGVSVVGVDRLGFTPELDSIRPLVADLADPGGVDAVLEVAAGLDVGLVINNAAISYEGPFVEQGVARALAQLDINCRAPLLLAHALLPRLVARGRGGMIFLSSMSAWRGAPLVTGYAATKAWNLILAESLWEEVREAGVDVMAVLPGSTRTPGLLSSMPQASMGTAHLMDPPDVVREALDTLGSVPSMTPGQANRDSESFMQSLDRVEAVKLMGQVMRQMYPPERTPDPAI